MRRPVKNRIQPQPDEVYGSFKVAKLINYVMERGKKDTARKIVYQVMENLKQEGDPVAILEEALEKVALGPERRSRVISEREKWIVAYHEAGHALYEQGVSPRYHRTMLEGGASLGVHESQSRLWENLAGRSRPFWRHFYPMLQARFPSQLSAVPVDQFYREVNKVAPSLIRVEADELTYNLHIMLRVELELALIEGTVEVRDLPRVWNEKMQEYLGIVPPNDADGVLQDIHWSAGLFGYFATYTMGNVIAAQLWQRYGALQPERDAVQRLLAAVSGWPSAVISNSVEGQRAHEAPRLTRQVFERVCQRREPIKKIGRRLHAV